MSTDTMIALSVAEALLLVVVLALALTRVRQGLSGISGGLTALAGALATVESQHLRPLGAAVAQINARFATICACCRGSLPRQRSSCARSQGDRHGRSLAHVRRAHRLARPARCHPKRSPRRCAQHHSDGHCDCRSRAGGSKDLDAVIALVTTQNYISQTVAGLANYGGSLDAALPNA